MTAITAARIRKIGIHRPNCAYASRRRTSAFCSHDAAREDRNTQTSLGKARKLKRETEDRFARRNFLVRAVDNREFAEVALASLCYDKAATREF
jgi:hypothetical protein